MTEDGGFIRVGYSVQPMTEVMIEAATSLSIFYFPCYAIYGRVSVQKELGSKNHANLAIQG
ncbi:MAG: hypothetical protein LBV68_03005 [Spirochaetaceae bacterium]|jgi:hypothetical protein|nr:hypothetical protein [Spirochaetaceae bacterium]